MKKMMHWVLAATLVCGASVFTSCSSDNSDNSGSIEQAKKDRKEFVAHTRATLKDLAENMNFTSWNAANQLNTYFNQYVLNNPGFEKAVLNAFMQKVMASVKPVEAGSELAAMGYQMYGTVDLTDFNYRFTEKSDITGFDIEQADDFEVVLCGWNPTTQQVEAGVYKVTLKSGGDTSYKFVQAIPQMPGMALMIQLPSEFRFAIADRLSGQWHDGFSGSFKNQVDVAPGHEYAQLSRDNWNVSGTITSEFPAAAEYGIKADKTTFDFSIDDNRTDNSTISLFGWSQNGRKMIDLSFKQHRDASAGTASLDLTQFNSASSIIELFAAWLSTRSLDEAKLTLLDDLTTTLSISDMQQALLLAQQSAAARRAYADEQTIDQYTQQLNQLIKCEMTCKGVSQTIPMRLTTQKFGVDWWTMPSFNFADEQGYVSLTDLLDAQSVAYGINIIDHAAAPMQQSMIVVRQLLQYIQGLASGFQQQGQQQGA